MRNIKYLFILLINFLFSIRGIELKMSISNKHYLIYGKYKKYYDLNSKFSTQQVFLGDILRKKIWNILRKKV